MAQQPPYNPQGQQPQQWRQPPPAKKTSGCLIALVVAVAVGVPMLGVMAALGIYGVRRYLAAAKTVEAKNNVAAISRGAVSAFERESTTAPTAPHRLCASAIPVPAAVPPAKKYLPSSAAGQDFNSGSATAGWTCLRFNVTTPVYYQYQYHQGSGWIVPSIAPGPDGFEASAQGDLDGNGVTSKFARVGKVVNGKVTLSNELYVENELE